MVARRVVVVVARSRRRRLVMVAIVVMIAVVVGGVSVTGSVSRRLRSLVVAAVAVVVVAVEVGVAVDRIAIEIVEDVLHDDALFAGVVASQREVDVAAIEAEASQLRGELTRKQSAYLNNNVEKETSAGLCCGKEWRCVVTQIEQNSSHCCEVVDVAVVLEVFSRTDAQ